MNTSLNKFLREIFLTFFLLVLFNPPHKMNGFLVKFSWINTTQSLIINHSKLVSLNKLLAQIKAQLKPPLLLLITINGLFALFLSHSLHLLNILAPSKRTRRPPMKISVMLSLLVWILLMSPFESYIQSKKVKNYLIIF